MKAIKENKVYTIDETQKATYKAQGYDIVDEKGNVLEYGVGKKVSYEEYHTLQEKVNKLEEENKKLKEENKKLKEESKETKKGTN